ncbi:MAG: PfkB family carbohydrate kinase [Planctomycetota bacterium]
MTDSPLTVVGLGEALFDVFETGPRLGGAPLNVAVHAHRLLRPRGGRGVVVSRIADDELGRQLLDELDRLGLTDQYLQRHADEPTGRVEVKQPGDGSHSFHIAPTSAWDQIEFQSDTADLAASCAAVAFGTLAQRDARSQRSIHAFLAAAPQAVKLFDVNLRSSDGRDFYDAPTLFAGCDAADVVKLNDEELDTVCRLTETNDAGALLQQFNLDAVVLTRGADGTAAYTADGFVEGPKVTYDWAEGSDTVGAGDACSAGLLSALVLGHDLLKALELANHMGAYVAGQPGATPELPASIVDLLEA